MAEHDRLNQYLQILSETRDLKGDEISIYYQWNPDSKKIVDEFKSKTLAQRHAVPKRESNYARDYTKRFDDVADELGFSDAVFAINKITEEIEPEDLPKWFNDHPKALEIVTQIREIVDKTPIEL